MSRYWDTYKTNGWTISGTKSELGTMDVTAGNMRLVSALYRKTGKLFFEVDLGVASGNHIYSGIGFCTQQSLNNADIGENGGSWSWYADKHYDEGTLTSHVIAESATDQTWGCLLDLDNGEGWLVVDGVIYGHNGSTFVTCTAAEVSAGTNPYWSSANFAGVLVAPGLSMYSAGQTGELKVLDSEFSGFTIPDGYSAWGDEDLSSEYWSGIRSESTITLSGTNNEIGTGTVSKTGQSAISKSTNNSGLTYAELEFTNCSSYHVFGICLPTAVGTDRVGFTDDSWGYMENNRYYHDSGYVTGGGGFGNSVVGICINHLLGKVWFSVDDVWEGDPVAGTDPAFEDADIANAVVHLMAGPRNVGDTLTLRIQEEEFNYTPPTGYSAWYAPPPPERPTDTEHQFDVTVDRAKYDNVDQTNIPVTVKIGQSVGTNILDMAAIVFPEIDKNWEKLQAWMIVKGMFVNASSVATGFTDAGGYTGHTLRCRMDLTTAGQAGSTTKIRLWIPPKPGGYTWSWTKLYVGKKGTGSLDLDGTQIEVLVGGLSGGASGTEGVWSDWMDYALDTTDEIVVSYHTTAGTPPYKSVSSVAEWMDAGQASGDSADADTWGGSTGAASWIGGMGFETGDYDERDTQLPIGIEYWPGKPAILGTPRVEYEFGTDYGGDEGFTIRGAPVLNADHVSFDGIDDGYDGVGDLGDSGDTAIHAIFRPTNKALGTAQIVWKDGGLGNGYALGIDTNGDLGIFGRQTSRTQNTISIGDYEDDVIYEVWGDKEKFTIFNYETGKYLATVEGTIVAGDGSAAEGVGFASEQCPITAYNGHSSYGAVDIFYVGIYAADGIVQHPLGVDADTDVAVISVGMPRLDVDNDTFTLFYDNSLDENPDYVTQDIAGYATPLIAELPDPTSNSASGYTRRQVIRPLAQLTKGDKIRIKWYHTGTDTYAVGAAYFGICTDGAYALGANPTPVTMGGLTAFTVDANNLWSDEITLNDPIDGTQELMLCFYHTGSNSRRSMTIDNSRYRQYYDSGDHTGDVPGTGFAATNDRYEGAQYIEVIRSEVPPNRQVWNDAIALIKHDPMNGGVIDVMNDTNPTLVGTETIVDGLLYKSLDFNNVDNELTAILDADKTEGTVISVMKSDTPVLNDTIIGPSEDVVSGIAIGYADSNQIGVWPSGSGAYHSELTVDLSDWQFLAIQWDTSTIYSSDGDGNETSEAFSNAYLNENFSIGNAYGQEYWDGPIDRVLIYESKKTQSFIDGLKAQWFDEVNSYHPFIPPTPFRTAYCDLSYSLYPVEVTSNHCDLIYSINAVFISYVDEVYSAKLMNYIDEWYWDSPIVTAYVNEYYKSHPELMTYVDIKYGDTRPLVAFLDEFYTITQQLLSYVDLPYTIAEKVVMAYKDLGYDIKDTNPVVSFIEELYAIAADSVIELSDLIVTIDGERVYPFHVNFEINRESYKMSAEVHIKDIAAYNAVIPGESVLRIQDGIDDIEVVTTIPTEYDNVGNTYYVIPGESKSRILEKSEALTEEFVGSMASDIVIEMAGRYGITVEWNVMDWFIPSNVLYANDETPYQIIHKITSAIGAVLQPTYDGNLRVEPNMESNSNKWEDDEPTYYLTDQRNFFSTSENPSDRPGYNLYNIGDYGDDEERTWLEEEEVTEHEKIIKAYRVPFDDQTLKLFTSDSNATIEANGIVYEQIDEEIEIVSGEGNVQKPIYELVSATYNDADLGGVEFQEDGTITTDVPDQSMIKISYKTKYWSWNVIDQDVESTQFWVEIG